MNNAVFFDAVRGPVFGGTLKQSQVDGVNIILTATDGLDITWRAYALATVWHETGQMMQPIKETVLASHKDHNPSDATVIARLDKAFKAGKLTWVKTPYWRDGWFGRGYVQLTHKANYAAMSPIVGADLVANRDLALDPAIAAKVLVEGMKRGTFTGAAFKDYLPGSYMAARRIVNGTDKAATIAGAAEKFEAALRMAQNSAPPADHVVEPVRLPSFWAGILASLKGFWK